MRFDLDKFKIFKDELEKHRKNTNYGKSIVDVNDLHIFLKDENIHDKNGRYIIFYYESYYPSGGMEDCILRTDDLEGFKQILSEVRRSHYGYINCFDINTDETFNLK